MLKYEDISKAKYTNTEFKLYNDTGNQIYISSFDNSDYISDGNNVFMHNAFYYNFDNDTINIKLVISFSMIRTGIKILYSSVNSDRLIIKHYGN